MAFVRVPGNPEPEGIEEHWFEGRGGVRIRAALAPALAAPRGSVILAPGRTEFIEKYFEVISELQRRGFAVFAVDWRGQGMSDRSLTNALKGHFESFDDPVNDIASALKLYAERLPRPHIVLAHSMGGAILLRAMQTRRVEADAAVFSAPMWGIANLGDLSKSFIRFMHAIGAGHLFAPGVDKKWKREHWRRSPVTHDKERHARNQGLVIEDSHLALAGPTISWVAAAAEACEAFMAPSALAHIRIPVTIVTAGREQLVDNRQAQAIAQILPDCELVNVTGAKHELMMEQDQYRAQFWDAFDRVADHVSPAPVA
ncbi:MAG: alpha/beta hydrolase [Caulobacterales bacterium]